jgi:hypothetical protein
MIYFVIRKYKSNFSETYRIEKHTNNLDEANKFLSALSLLEQDEYVSFFVSAHKFQEPFSPIHWYGTNCFWFRFISCINSF